MEVSQDASQSVRPEDWVNEHYASIRHMAWMLCGDHWLADDMAQETFVRGLDQWHRFRGDSSIRTWLISILMRVDAGRHRQIARTRIRIRKWWLARHSGTPAVEDPAKVSEAKCWAESLWSRVAELRPKHRQVLMLKFGEELDYECIALALNCPVGTVKSRVHHALKLLRGRLRSQHEGTPCAEQSNASIWLTKPLIALEEKACEHS